MRRFSALLRFGMMILSILGNVTAKPEKNLFSIRFPGDHEDRDDWDLESHPFFDDDGDEFL